MLWLGSSNSITISLCNGLKSLKIGSGRTKSGYASNFLSGAFKYTRFYEKVIMSVLG